MPNIRKTNLHPIANSDLGIIGTGNDTVDNAHGIFHGIWRLHRRLTTTQCLSALPLRFLLLDMSAVPKHDAAKISSGVGHEHLPSEAFGIQQWQHARMVHMGMGQKYVIKIHFIHRQGNIFKYVYPLFHTVIHQNIPAIHMQEMAASCNLMVSTNKH